MIFGDAGATWIVFKVETSDWKPREAVRGWCLGYGGYYKGYNRNKWFI